MVAISLYKGNLHHHHNHRTPPPDFTTPSPTPTPTPTPHKWIMPTPKISLKDFKTLLHRRSKALSRLSQQSNSNPIDSPIPTQSNGGGSLPDIANQSNGVAADEKVVNFNDPCAVENDSDTAAVDVAQEEAPESDVQPLPPKDETLTDIEKRKKEIEEKLQVLNERKHKLVQVLKQILHAEEELRRRSNVQGVTCRPSISLQVDVSNDSGSMSRHVTPRPGSDGNCVADLDGADADDLLNPNIHPRNMTRMNSISPSSDSFHRRGPFSMVPNHSRGNLGAVAISPSRFAPTPTGQQGNLGILPTVSVTGTNYVATSPSPSPAGSGGTSVFRDARLPSPWN
uniref:G protein pathway suppressor 2 n=1 Tax=Erigeron canadensis TaxID=72917 RepID=UPI001CB9B540|nr:G protein pathway suppressor 2 [Erigeron canadensis]